MEHVDEKGLSILRKIGKIKIASSTDEEVLIKEAKDADVLIVRTAKITKRIIDNAPKLKVIASIRVGLEAIDVYTATKKGIFVIRPEQANTDSVAEHTICLILALSKNLLKADRELKAGNWKIRDMILRSNMELRGKTIGIIGMGAIGRKVAKISQAFGMKVLGFDPYVPDEVFHRVKVIKQDLTTILKEADIISIHALLTQETYHMLDEDEFRLMKKKPIVINTARGSIINEKALIKALKEGWIAGAGLDTFEEEPPISDIYDQLFKFENVIITPHIAGLTWEARERTMLILAENIIQALEGKIPKNAINPEAAKRSPLFR
jgi:D-3-phosphoglycerate dehydrogenase